jgi:hypothetical protein
MPHHRPNRLLHGPRSHCDTVESVAVVLLKRDKANLDIFWLRDKSLEESDDLPAPDILAKEIVDDLQTALEQFANIASELAE